MCKAITDLIQDGRDEGKIEGKIEAFVELINDGDMTIKEAADKMQVSEKEFCTQAEALELKIAI